MANVVHFNMIVDINQLLKEKGIEYSIHAIGACTCNGLELRQDGKEYPIDEIIEWKTIVSEAVSNAIIHGYNQNTECSVVMKMKIDGRQVQLIVQDYGKGIENLEEVKAPFYTTAKDLEHAGMGLTIIETLADQLEIESVVNIGTKLIITKSLKNHDTI